jgi:hypothetical protein
MIYSLTREKREICGKEVMKGENCSDTEKNFEKKWLFRIRKARCATHAGQLQAKRGRKVFGREAIAKPMKVGIVLFAVALTSECVLGQATSYDVTARAKPRSVESPAKSDLAKQFPHVGPSKWTKGMRFMGEPARGDYDRTAGKIALVPYHSRSYSTWNGISQLDFQWKIFTYQGVEVDTPRYGGSSKASLIFECENETYKHECAFNPAKNKEAFDEYESVSKLVYMEEIDTARAALVGKTVYIMTNRWMQDDAEGVGRYIFKSKYIEVMVTAVGLGTQDGPVRIVFRPSGMDAEYYIDVYISGVNSTVIMGTHFDAAFQLTDPRLSYPKISNNAWKHIQECKVSVGMSRQECELSWGKPSKINTTTTGNTISEQWVYSSGSYLYLKNGRLTSIQN